MTRSNPFGGKWRIVSSDTWDPEALDEFGPTHIVFGPRGRGELCFIAISASVDYRAASRDGSPIVEFSWLAQRPEPLAVGVDGFGHLDRELAGGREHERMHLGALQVH